MLKRRPLAVFALFYFLTTLLASLFTANGYISAESCVIFGAFAAVISALTAAFSKRITPAFTAAVSCAAALLIFAVSLKSDTLELKTLNISDKVYSVSGTVCDNLFTDTGQILTIELKTLDGVKTDIKTPIKLYVSDVQPIKIGSGITAELSFKEMEEKTITLYSRRAGIYAESEGEIKYSPSDNLSPYLKLMTLRQELSFSLKSVLGSDIGGILNKAIFGYGDISGTKAYKSFYESGIGHVLAVSGLHVSIVCAALMFLLLKLGLNRNIANVISIWACIFYVMLVGAPYSAVRAGIMSVIFFSSLLLGRAYDSLISLSVSVILILVFSPYAVLNYGFLYSVGCTLAIILFSSKISNVLKSLKALKPILKYRVTGYFVSAFAVTLSANTAIILFSALGMGKFPILSIPINVISSVFIAPIISLGLMCAVCASLGGIFTYIAYASGLFCSVGVKFLTLLSQIGWNLREFSISFDTFPMKAALIVSVSLILILFYKNNAKNKRIAVFSVFVIMLITLYLRVMFYKDNVVINKVMTSQSESVLISSGKEDILFAVCYDGDDVRKTVELLEKSSDGVCDILIYPYIDDESAAYVKKLCSEIYPDTLISSEDITYDKSLKVYCGNVSTDVFSDNILTISMADDGAVISFKNGAEVNLSTEKKTTVSYNEKTFNIVSDREVFTVKR